MWYVVFIVIFDMFLLCCLVYVVLYLPLVDFCCWYTFVIFFFFFKQKTAYEMRISDWSSDVCSSDLVSAQSNPFIPTSPVSKTDVQRMLDERLASIRDE